MNVDALQLVGRYATPEVLTVFGAVLTAWIGWVACSKTFGLIGAFAQKVSFLGLTAAILFISGIGTTGLGVGELATRWSASPSKPEKLGMTDATLTNLATQCRDREMAKLILDYTRLRDADPKAEEMRIVTQLVERNVTTSQSEKDREANSRALVAFMEYLKVREQTKVSPVKNCESGIMVASTSDNFVNDFLTTKKSGETSAVSEPKDNKDSLLTIPMSLSLIGMGLGASICGVCCYNHRRNNH